MAKNVITFITLAALACLATDSRAEYYTPYTTIESGRFKLPADVYCTTRNNTACTQRYPNTVCYQEAVCKYGDSCKCATGYALYSFYNSTSFFIEYSCRPATMLVGGWCNNTLGNTCSGYRTYCQQYTGYSVCECRGNYKPNADRTDCIPLNLQQNCTNGECGVNAYCDSHMLCRCQPGYKPYNATGCTHYKPGDTCPDNECEFVESSSQSCGYGTCKNGVFECIPGSRWWQYGTPKDEEPSPLVDGMCLRNTVTVVNDGELCDLNVEQTSDYACRSDRCVKCPEQDDVFICNASGATSSKTISAATSLILLLACYLFH